MSPGGGGASKKFAFLAERKSVIIFLITGSHASFSTAIH